MKKKCNYLIDLHCNPIGIIRTSVNWKKQLDRSWLLAISFRDRFKIKKKIYFENLLNYQAIMFLILKG
ncbi:MAG: hypothetical protein CMB93_03375 [Flammeovirgaceae bacterium]|nr:hypothetical protein [Flammeovirgaceae bacterium]